jgi:REP element-mobilizing transposase RayT
VPNGTIAEQLKELIYETAKDLECKVLALEIMDDHVHLFLNSPPTLSPLDIMFRIKVRWAFTLPSYTGKLAHADRVTLASCLDNRVQVKQE